jgi:hypothetical protein
MALRLLGTNAATSLRCLTSWSAVLTRADIAAISHGICPSSNFASVLGSNAIGPKGILCTGATHTNTTLDTLVRTGGGPLANIQLGDIVFGADIVPGTCVVAKPTATSVTLSVAATGSNAERVAFMRFEHPWIMGDATIEIPGRGTLKIRPGDVIAVDNTGWPILVSAAAISYAGSQWTLT